jgi:hypothetical protein
MNMDTTMLLLDQLVELQMEPATAMAPMGARRSHTRTARSKENILQWRTYLPEDCVKTMIDMSWDVTT